MDFYKAAFGAVELYRVEGGGVGQLAVNRAEFWPRSRRGNWEAV